MGGTVGNNPTGGGLLGDSLSSPLLNIGAGLLAASGPSLVPISTGQGIAQGIQLAQGARSQGLRNQLVRSRLEDDARRRKAIGLLGEQNPQLGLLGELAPGATVQGLLNERSPRQSGLERKAAALGIDLNTLSEADKRSLLLGGGGDAKTLLTQVQLEKELDALRSARTEKEQGKAARRFTVTDNLSKVNELRELNATRRQIMAGEITNPLTVASIVQRWQQLSTELVNSGGSEPFRKIGGRLTDAARRSLFDSKVGNLTLPDNADKILDGIEKGLREAGKIFGAKLPEAGAAGSGKTRRMKFDAQGNLVQ